MEKNNGIIFNGKLVPFRHSDPQHKYVKEIKTPGV
jgi:hypothetical protein